MLTHTDILDSLDQNQGQSEDINGGDSILRQGHPRVPVRGLARDTGGGKQFFLGMMLILLSVLEDFSCIIKETRNSINQLEVNYWWINWCLLGRH